MCILDLTHVFEEEKYINLYIYNVVLCCSEDFPQMNPVYNWPKANNSSVMFLTCV